MNRGNKINATGTADASHHLHQPGQCAGPRHQHLAGQVGRRGAAGPRAHHRLQRGWPAALETCWRDTEGSTTPAQFGGNTPADNSGTLDYVQIRYSGFILSANTELQALTLEGTGSGTTIAPRPLAQQLRRWRGDLRRPHQPALLRGHSARTMIPSTPTRATRAPSSTRSASTSTPSAIRWSSWIRPMAWNRRPRART